MSMLLSIIWWCSVVHFQIVFSFFFFLIFVMNWSFLGVMGYISDNLKVQLPFVGPNQYLSLEYIKLWCSVAALILVSWWLDAGCWPLSSWDRKLSEAEQRVKIFIHCKLRYSKIPPSFFFLSLLWRISSRIRMLCHQIQNICHVNKSRIMSFFFNNIVLLSFIL